MITYIFHLTILLRSIQHSISCIQLNIIVSNRNLIALACLSKSDAERQGNGGDTDMVGRAVSGQSMDLFYTFWRFFDSFINVAHHDYFIYS